MDLYIHCPRAHRPPPPLASLHFIPSKTMLQYYTLYPFGSAPAGELPARPDFLLEKQTRRGSAKVVCGLGEHGITENRNSVKREASNKATQNLHRV